MTLKSTKYAKIMTDFLTMLSSRIKDFIVNITRKNLHLEVIVLRQLAKIYSDI